MQTYSIAQVEILTGIKAHTIRIWESRYGFIKPQRSDTNIRSYSDEQVRLLINTSILLQNGYRISNVAKMKTEELHEKVLEIISDYREDVSDQIKGLKLAMLDFDGNLFREIFDRVCFQKGFFYTMTEMIYPFLRITGGLWTTSEIFPGQEHFISNLIRQKMIGAIEALLPIPAAARRILLFLPPLEYHEIGLLMAYYIAKHHGWNVYYLGQNVPFRDVVLTTKKIRPEAVFTILTMPGIFEDLKLLSRKLDVPIFYSGVSSQLSEEQSTNNLIYVNNPSDLPDQLSTLINR